MRGGIYFQYVKVSIPLQALVLRFQSDGISFAMKSVKLITLKIGLFHSNGRDNPNCDNSTNFLPCPMDISAFEWAIICQIIFLKVG